MEAYYSQQAALPHFAGYYRQRGSGFGALAAGIGRFALPLAKKFVVPAAKKIGRELLKQAVPELIDVVTKKKSPKQAVKSTITKTIKKQTGGSRRRRRRVTVQRGGAIGQKRRRSSTSYRKRKNSRSISRSRPVKRSRSDFFSKVRND